MEEKPGSRQNLARTMARTPSALGKRPGPQSRRDVRRWRCVRRTKKATGNRTSRSGMQGGTCGTGSSGRKSLWETQARGGVGDERQNRRNSSRDLQLDDGGRSRLWRGEKRLLQSSETWEHAAAGACRAFAGFEL